MKVDIDLVKCTLQRLKVPAKETATIIQEIVAEAKAAEVAQGEKEPAIKKQYVFLLSDPYGKLAGDSDFTGWVVQIPEDDNPATVIEKLLLGVEDFNRSAKGKRYPIRSVAEACEFGSAQIFKAQKLWVKTKEPVLVIRTGNKLRDISTY